MAFPVAYGLLFAIVLVELFRAPQYVLALALAAAFTAVKTVLIFATLGAAGVGALRWLVARPRC